MGPRPPGGWAPAAELIMAGGGRRVVEVAAGWVELYARLRSWSDRLTADEVTARSAHSAGRAPIS
ncbi:hypothetical protein CLV68_4645 [Actinokineospora cianjurensis]|uniref:Uncharacterized protein n=1 Tax=Actinokineospora cianjurensis TaxID=585224 RepID=A0A421AZ76_9PSEU|nr:hypothetical protein CLV68_4645 [Actinokineospora cianjurensis]